MKKLPEYETNTALALSTWVEIMKTFNRIRALELTLIEANNLTIGQFALLELLYHRGKQSIGAATVLTMSTPGNMTVVVKNLIKRGLITTSQNPNDKRSSILNISEKGADIMKVLFPEHSQRIKNFLSGITFEEQEDIRLLLRKLNQSLRGDHHV